VLLDEYERWTGDRKLVRDLEYEAGGAALDRRVREPPGQRLRLLQRRNEKTGLENQCWKDSWDSISYRDGRLPGSRAPTCELQGYAYDAKVRGAATRARVWKDPATPTGSRRQAADLKRRFNRDFWVGDREYFALALDADGKQVDTLTSNNGHLLWSGIVEQSKARSVVRHLLGQRLFSGWGVRTLAEGEARYNPIGYHVGTVWPFDNSFIAWGLRRYGFKEEAARDRAADPRRRGLLRGPSTRGLRRLRASGDEVPGSVPDGLQPAGVVDGSRRFLLLRTMLGHGADRRPPRRSTPRLPEGIGPSGDARQSRGGGGASTPSAARQRGGSRRTRSSGRSSGDGERAGRATSAPRKGASPASLSDHAATKSPVSCTGRIIAMGGR
jgi:hypothetical protein